MNSLLNCFFLLPDLTLMNSVSFKYKTKTLEVICSRDLEDLISEDQSPATPCGGGGAEARHRFNIFPYTKIQWCGSGTDQIRIRYFSDQIRIRHFSDQLRIW